MDLMFSSKAEHHENALRPCRKWHWQNPSFRKMEVRKARQIAAENAAWWSKEVDRWNYADFKHSTPAKSHAKYSFAADQMSRWQCVYDQGQLYARDTVRAFDPKYGEE